MINIQSMSKSYGHTQILDNVTTEFEPGCITGLIGPSGAGKTTLIKCILGMESIDNGTITIKDISIPNREILRSIGYMAQSDALFEDLTTYENMKFFGKLYIGKDLNLNHQIDKALNMVNLSDEANKKVKDFSGGMKRRLSLAISFIQDPEILILDEPTVGIDPKLRKSIWNDLFDVRDKGKTILVTTHVLDEADKCDKLLLMRDGKIISYGSPNEIKHKFNADTIEDVFLKLGDDDDA
ncbi:ABC transporter ATP-binding protein [Mammaliicoccus stepanovicii]|uniref:ABC transporter, ATP-binding protein n=1 Tax=Mammaliicoccus stepanovicii TaxID=643214 RepID=A0A239ZRD8_9STAP|nr:ABC transporter ATP-binding protein [Mammaliicoccus stepanovicii]PNZ74330.1 glycosyl transferase family 2 [Mammaliicoccus stepanovicii]GGI38789.1 ABC transporter ATP-binding protein [Mammaliicoccus stepanovicii]SNV73822.1 ABC transporter, ATP-binding protein [Mammaliicoccus stepanovicii]